MFCSKFSIRTEWVDPYITLMKYFEKDLLDRTAISFHQIFLKGNMSWTILSFAQNFLENHTVGLYCLLMKTAQKDNIAWTMLSFGQNFRRRLFELNGIVFWSKYSKKTTWVEPYRLYIKLFLKYCEGWTTLSFGQNFLKRQSGLNHILFLSKFS